MHAALKLINHRFQQPDPGATGTPGVAAPPVSMVSQQPGTTPLVLDSPHSGTFYPHDFGAVCDLPTLRRAEDTHVEKIYAFAPALGVAWVEAHFPRIYLDANRDTTELDTTLLDGEWTDPISTDPKVLSKVRLGKGLIWKFTDEGEPIYNRLLSVAEVRARIDRCWRPYHAAVAQAIDAAHARHGYSIHINCHSMPAVAASHATEFPGMVHADFVVGDHAFAVIDQLGDRCIFKGGFAHRVRKTKVAVRGVNWHAKALRIELEQRFLSLRQMRIVLTHVLRSYHKERLFAGIRIDRMLARALEFHPGRRAQPLATKRRDGAFGIALPLCADAGQILAQPGDLIGRSLGQRQPAITV